MSFLSPSKPKQVEMPAVPDETQAENAALMESMKQKKRRGFASTILTDSDSIGAAPTRKKTLLGE